MKALDRLLQHWRIAKARRFVPPGANVLDVGCGDGAIFRQLRAKISRGTGIDAAIGHALTAGKYTLLPGQFPQTVPKENNFDAITLLATLEHFTLPDLENISGACAGLLNPTGLLIITVPSPMVDAILGCMRWLRLVEAETLAEHHGFDPAATQTLFSDNFHPVHQEKFQLGLNNLYVFKKRSTPVK